MTRNSQQNLSRKPLRRRVWRYWQQHTIIQIASITALVLVFQNSAFVFPRLPWLPSAVDVNSFLRTIWQVHASVIGISVIVTTIIVTVIANERDRSRTWKLYSERTRILPIIWFNLILIASEGLAVLQTYEVVNLSITSDRASNLLVLEFVLFVIAVALALWLFTETLRFLDEDYVETLAQKRIVSAIPEAVERDIYRLQQMIARLQGDVGGSGA